MDPVMFRPGAARTAAPEQKISLAHGAGGRAMRRLIDDIILPRLQDPALVRLEDQATLDLAPVIAQGDRLAMTTDSFVVDPLFFPGGDIGSLAVSGTVNDLAMGGAIPLYLTCGLILEEGLPVSVLERVVDSLRATADRAGVRIVAGDTKVVGRGQADKLFINTSGVGVIPAGVALGADRLQPGDHVLVSGPIGKHGAAIADARGDFGLENDIQSDCRPLNGLVAAMLAACPSLRALRDATRGGIATVLNEFAAASGVAIRVQETAIPLEPPVNGLCELLGLDPLYLANEGTLIAVAPPETAPALLAAMRAHPDGAAAALIGSVDTGPAARVVLQTRFGGERVVDLLTGEQLPRIC
ncbi:MAG: hydrogenase expression/formation protein HypE [Magnetospiraceae bacterium]